jgi:hypothetical protein
VEEARRLAGDPADRAEAAEVMRDLDAVSTDWPDDREPGYEAPADRSVPPRRS